MKVCVQCGKICKDKYCSYKCRYQYEKEHNKKEKQCIECNNIFFTHNNSKFCSKTCSSKSSIRKASIKRLLEHKAEYEKIALRQLPTQKEPIFYEQEGIYAKNKNIFLMPHVVKKCFCGRKFATSTTDESIFCSNKCFQDSKRKYVTRKCLTCNKECTIYDQEIPYFQFCSKECEDNYTNIPINKDKCTCINCSKVYITLTNNSAEFCSYKCKTEFNYKMKLKEKQCKLCGKTFLTVYDGIYCSKSCSAQKRAMPKPKHIWNKGLTKENCELIKQNTIKQSDTLTNMIINNEFVPTNKCKHGFSKSLGHYVRSSWEFNFGQILKYLKREYKYEKTKYTLSDGSVYIPDFFDVKRNCYYEIKGYEYEDFKIKFAKFKQEFPYIKVKLIRRKEYQKIYNKFINKCLLFKCFNKTPLFEIKTI